MADVPGSGLPIIGTVISVLETLFGSQTDTQGEIVGLQTAATHEWANQLTVAQWAWGELQAIGSILKTIGLAIGLALYHIWEDYLKPIIDKIIKAIKWLHDKIRKVLKPVTDIINWIIKHIIQPIVKWAKIVINIISAIRLFLELLILVHVKWAAKLDAELQKIQGYITQALIDILAPLNEVQTILGLVIDPGMIIRRSAFGGSLWNSLGDVKAAAGFGSARPIMPDEAATAKGFTNAVYGTQPLQTVGPDGSVVYDPALQMVNDSISQQMQTAGIAQ